MGELVSTFADNMYELEEKAYETHESYLDYVYDTVDTANENMETLEENLETAYHYADPFRRVIMEKAEGSHDQRYLWQGAECISV